MYITDKRETTKVLFKDIDIGECFIDEDNELNIKIDTDRFDVQRGHPNAVTLDAGHSWSCDADTEVIPVRVRAIIEE